MILFHLCLISERLQSCGLKISCSWVWRYTSIIPALEKPRKEDHESKVSLVRSKDYVLEKNQFHGLSDWWLTWSHTTKVCWDHLLRVVVLDRYRYLNVLCPTCPMWLSLAMDATQRKSICLFKYYEIVLWLDGMVLACGLCSDSMLCCQKVGCTCFGSGPLHPVGIPAFSLPAAICSGHLGFPIAGYWNSVRPNHYTQLPNHIHLPHIPSHARLAFNELAQIETLRNLLIFFF